MTKEELVLRLEAPVEQRMVEMLSGIADDKFAAGNKKGYFTINEVLELTFYPKKEVAFRAAWLLEYCFFNYHCVGDYLDNFLNCFPEQQNQSVMRHYGKIFAYITSKKATGLKEGQLAQADLDPIIDVMFSWLIDEHTLVATKVHAMQALANLAPKYDWIKDELLQTIDHLCDQESYAFFARAKQIRKALKKIKH